MRYQFPLSTQSDGASQFDISPRFAFDGSVGLSYNLTPRTRLGMFWYGQWHEYEFKNAPDAFSGDKISGDQSLFFSNWEFRMGFEFD
jgi:hypothetical protein